MHTVCQTYKQHLFLDPDNREPMTALESLSLDQCVQLGFTALISQNNRPVQTLGTFALGSSADTGVQLVMDNI